MMVLGLASIIGLVLALFVVRGNPGETATKFMDALARSDLETLVEVSYIPGTSEAQLREKWEKTLHIGRNFAFTWQILSQTQNSDTSAVAFMTILPDLNNPQAFELKIQLPMELVDGEWKVDLRRVPRDIYPALPR